MRTRQAAETACPSDAAPVALKPETDADPARPLSPKDGGAARVQGPAAGNEAYGLPPVLTPEEAAAFARLPTRAIYRAIQRGSLPACRDVRPFRILREHLISWISGGLGTRNKSAPRSVVALARQARVVPERRRR